MEKFDIVVIGAGPGGYPAAIRAAQLGASVALIEKEALGGTCLNWGCIPTKTLVASSQLFAQMKRSAELGLKPGEMSFDYAAMSQRKDEVVAKLRSGLSQLLKGNGIKVFNGTGSFVGRNKIAITPSPIGPPRGRVLNPETHKCARDVKAPTPSGKEVVIEAGNTIIATGSEPAMPGFLPKNKCVVDSRAFLELTELPLSLIVLGGGMIGCEFACLAARLGVKVIIVEMLEDIVMTLDSDIRRELRRCMEKELGIRVLTGKALSNIKANKDSVSGKSGKERVEAELLLVAVGRYPVTKGLGLKKAGIKTNEAGYIKVNEFCRTSAATVYAVGDITGGSQLAYVATSHGITAAENAVLGTRKRAETLVPMAMFTSPEIGSVGLQEHEASARGINVKTGKYMFSALGRAMTAGETEGFVKWVADAETDQLLGAHVIGPHATELIAEAASAIRSELTAEEVGRTMHCHPTFSEAWMEAAHAVHGECIHQPSCRRR